MRMVGDDDALPSYEHDARRRLMMREFMADDAEYRIELPWLHGARGVEINCDAPFRQSRVAISERSKLALPAQSPAQWFHFKPLHSKNTARAIKQMRDKRLVARIKNVHWKKLEVRR